MTELEIQFFDGTQAFFNIIDGAITEQWKEQTRAEVEILRREWQTVVNSVDKINDEFYVLIGNQRVFGGRLINYSNEEDSVILSIGSFEEDALTAQPTDATETFSTTDRNVVLDAISRIPNLSAGTVEELTSSVGFVFSNSSPAKMIRDCQQISGAFIKYNADKTIDYLEYPTGESPIATIGPNERNVQDDFRVIENEREEFTNIRVLGAGEGDSRIQAEGSITSTSGREKWGKYADNSITSQSRAEEVLQNLIDEYENSPVRTSISTTIFGIDPEVGSKVQAVSDVDSIDKEMFVTRAQRRLEGVQSVYEVTLSNRLVSEQDSGRQRRQSIGTFNQGYQGQVVTINSGGYRAPIDTGVPYEFSVRLPNDIVNELTAELEIQSLPYRTYVSANTHDHEVSISAFSSSESNSDFETIQQRADAFTTVGLSANGGFQTIDSFTPNDNTSFVFSSLFVNPEINDATGTYFVRLINTDTGTQYGGDRPSFAAQGSPNLNGIIPEDCVNDTVAWQIDPRNSDYQFTIGAFWAAAGRHTHTVSISDTTTSDSAVGFQNGVNEFGGTLPSNVGVEVNSSQVATNVGSGQFNEVVDIGGELSPGFNLVRVTSDSLGHMRATAFVDVFRQITQ